MAKPQEILVAFLAAHGNRRLEDGAPVPLDRVKEPIRFWREGDAAPCSFDAWVEGATGFYAVDVARLDGKELPQIVLAVRRGGRHTLCRVETSTTPRTTLSGKDVLAYLDELAERDAIRERLAKSSVFANAETTADGTPLADEVSSVLASTVFSDAVRSAWSQHKNAHRNPHYGLIYDLHHGASQDVPICAARDEARSRLGVALDAIAAFAEAEKLDRWADLFRSTRRVLDGGPVDDWIEKRFEGSRLDHDSLSLLCTAWKADVFGGMGSWNDVAPSSDASNALFRALRPAVEAAINAAAPR